MRRKRRHRRQASYRNFKTVAVLGLSLSVIAGCSSIKLFQPEKEAMAQEQQVKTVKTLKVVKQKIGEIPEQAAEITASVQFDVLAETDGVVEEIFKKRGETVKQGDVILRLFSRDAKFEREKLVLAVKSTEDAINKARKDAELSRTELSQSIQKAEQGIVELTRNRNKTKNDYEAGTANKTQVQQAESQLSNAQLDLQFLKQKLKALTVADSSSLQTSLQEAQMNLQRFDELSSGLEVKAPADGILTEMQLQVGMPAGKGSKVGIIQKLDPVKVKAQLSEQAARLVRGKSELSFYLPGTSDKMRAGISFLSSVIDPQTKGYELSLEVPNPDLKFKPGMKTRIQLMDESEQNVLAIPVASILKKGEENFVFILVNGTVERRKVELGRLSDNELNQEVLSGVKEGDNLIISDPNQLKDQEKVQLASAVGQAKK
ncbi:efflux RND transporter periplasmic adaptor subunit [Paenibacillus filicis]|uniref:Efflux RND transporter periplasmic adaptor subunit n=1 Tax=Paenibacillus gyeongsangnamensis TaxID=3388067 RepID=A0ABT4QHX9_9BACL|nr:efflux RND transporter periplasmic adaptor subunit [Paenibacillus filicis]MCZ8516476.1 efflux RND transporter periplasmic adaptor subunit [Paenibacillus filicis]